MNNELTKTEIKEIKIEQGKIDDLNSKLSNEFEIIENSFVVQTNTALMKNSINGDFDEWKNKQKITRNQLKKDLKVSKENCKTIVNKSLDDTLINVNTAIMGIANQKIEKIDRVNLKAIANKGINLCSDQALKNFDKSVAKVYRLKNQMTLFDAILKQTQEGIENGLKIAYKNGRKVSFKSYMEMNVRTTTRQEANEYLFKASKSNGVVFYIANSFGDCADDHKDYQGKYYYDKDYKSFGYDKEILKRIKDVIAKYNMRSYQDVVNNKPYLTTRPNCRHSLRPVVLDDVFNNKTPEDMMKQYNIKKGTYHTGNYKALQRQRYNERMIRKYKTRLEQDKLLYDQNPNPKLKQLIDKDNELINYWENEQNSLLSKYKFLKRDRRREDNKVLVQDLGAGYSLGLKIDGKNMYVKEKVKTDIIKPKTKQAEKPKDIASSGKVEVKPKYTTYDIKKTKETLVGNDKLIDLAFENVSKDENTLTILNNINKITKINLKKSNKWNYNPSFKELNFANSTQISSFYHEFGHSLDHLVAYETKYEKEKQKFTWMSEEINDIRNQINEKNSNKIPENLSKILSDARKELIENAKKDLKDSGKMQELLKKEIKKKYGDNFAKQPSYIQKYIINDITIKETNKYIKEYSNNNKEYRGWECLSDIYDAISNGNARNQEVLLAKHGWSYYSVSGTSISFDTAGTTTKQNTEIFANFVEMKLANYNKQINFLKENEPKLYNKLEDIYKNIAETMEKI